MSNPVPEGWGEFRQGDVAKFSNGRAYKLDEWESHGTPVIRLQNLTGSGKDYYYSNLKLPDHQYCEYGDLLYMWSATFGPHIWKGPKAIYHYHIWKVTPDETNFTKAYAYQLLGYKTSEWLNTSNGMGILHVTKGGMEDLPLTLPPLPEQHKIAAILSSVDGVIEKTRAQIDKLKDLKSGMMQELLTKGVGSGGVPHTEFKDSPVGRIPACWEVHRADDISDAIMVGVVIKPTQYYVDQGVPALRSANVRENGLTMDNLKYFSEESNDRLHKSKLSKGDLLTVRTGYPGTTAVVTKEFEGCNCIDVVITRPSAEMDSDFLCLWVNSDHGKGQVLKAQGGLAQQHFNVGDMKNLLVPVPPLEEQRGIFRAVESVIGKLSISEIRLAQFSSLKKALMQDLLTGKVRVNVDQKESAVA
jgi:type I restriction enzyme, S subunit